MNYLFDIDGTLTLPRQRISDSFEEFFYNWMQGKKVYFVTGSDLKKVREQLSERIIGSASGIFCSMANELYIGQKKVYEKELKLTGNALLYLQEELANSSYSPKRTNNFEHRPGMLNFSIAGRDSNNEEREKYYLHDLKTGERKRIAYFINKNFGDTLEARVGGQISIDIQNVGNNKSQASKWVRTNVGGKMLFFGDKTGPDGNDYDIVKDIEQHGDGDWFNVQKPEQLKMMLGGK